MAELLKSGDTCSQAPLTGEGGRGLRVTGPFESTLETPVSLFFPAHGALSFPHWVAQVLRVTVTPQLWQKPWAAVPEGTFPNQFPAQREQEAARHGLAQSCHLRSPGSFTPSKHKLRGCLCQLYLVPQRQRCGQLWRHWCSGTSTRAPWCWPGAGPDPPRSCGYHVHHLLTPAPGRLHQRVLGEKSGIWSEGTGPCW